MQSKYLFLLALISLLSAFGCGGDGGSYGGGGYYSSSQSESQIPEGVYAQGGVKLCNGDLFFAGGVNTYGSPTANAYIYRVNSKTFVDVDFRSTKNDLLEPRVRHTMTLITNPSSNIYAPAPPCSVLITGGSTNYGISRTAEIYNPSTDRLYPVQNMHTARKNHTVTEILDSSSLLYGQFLVVGGRDDAGNILATAEVFDPNRGVFSVVSNRLRFPRENHTATPLKNGLILIAGGNTPGGVTDTGELFDPMLLSFSLITNSTLSEPRQRFTATYLDNKTSYITTDDAVLLAGGRDSMDFSLDSADFFDPFYNRFKRVNSFMRKPRFDHAATALPNNYISDVVITGGFTNLNTLNYVLSNPTDEVEIFNYVYTGGPSGYFSPTTPLLRAQALHPTHHIRWGTLLTLGGVDHFGHARTTAEEFYY